jgi:hypothetical protein
MIDLTSRRALAEYQKATTLTFSEPQDKALQRDLEELKPLLDFVAKPRKYREIQAGIR